MDATKRFGLTIAAIIRNEGPYLAEWIDYHALIGVEHFYLYDNGSGDDTLDVLRDYIVQGRVTLLAWPEFPGQIPAYNHATKIFGRDSDWMALIDADEFIQVEGDRTLPELLGDMRMADQILLPWMHFDSAGHHDKPAGLVIESYTRRTEAAHRQSKAIVRPEAVLWAEVHHCVTRNGRTADPAGRPLPERWILDRPPEGPIRLNHYFTKSRAEFAAKLARGQAGGGRGKTMDAFTRFDCPVEDASLAAMGPAVRRAMDETAARSKRPLVHAAWSAQSELTPSRGWTLRTQATFKEVRSKLAPDAILQAWSEIELQQWRVHESALRAMLPLFDAVRDGIAERIVQAPAIGRWQDADLAWLGRPYLALAGTCAGETRVTVAVEGRDAGGKPFASSRTVTLPAGAAVTVAVLSERTMTLDRVLLEADAPIAVLQAEICSFR